MRGKGFDADCVGVRTGITPAYAGKRSKSLSNMHKMLGSPPPMRGKG